MGSREWDRSPEPDVGPPDYGGAFISAACFYLVPLTAYVIWSATMSSEPRPGCVTAFGAPCPAQREEAFTNLFDHVPQVAVSLALSILVAMVLGRVTAGWKAWTVGFASAVLGAGIATVGFAVLATQV